jgi:hypothetical protein
MTVQELMSVLAQCDPKAEVRAVSKYEDSQADDHSFLILGCEHGPDPSGQAVCLLTDEED